MEPLSACNGNQKRMDKTIKDAEHAMDEPRRMDKTDVIFALVLGAVMIAVKLLEVNSPSLRMGRHTIDVIASTLCLGYILYRARRSPEKLDAWGLSTPLTVPALLASLAMLAAGIGVCAAGGILVAGKIEFNVAYLAQMVEYIPAAFPQQFAMCSIGLAALSTLRPLRGAWRLPLLVGVLFCLAHFWTPARIPGTIVPIQMPLTLVAGFAVSFYFLKFRTIVPLTAFHALLYPLLHQWIEVHL